MENELRFSMFALCIRCWQLFMYGWGEGRRKREKEMRREDKGRGWEKEMGMEDKGRGYKRARTEGKGRRMMRMEDKGR